MKIRWQRKSRAFTLFEVMTVLVIVGVLSVTLYNILFLNNSAVTNYITRMELWQDIDHIIDRMTDDIRAAHQISVSADSRSVSFFDQNNALISSYAILANGQCQRTGANGVTSLSPYLDHANSSFANVGPSSLSINLTLREHSLTGDVVASTSTEVFARNN